MYVNQQKNVHFTGAGLTSTVLGTVPWCSICRCGYGYHRILDDMAIGHLFFGNAWPWFLEISPSTKHNPDQQWRISSEWISTYIGVFPLPQFQVTILTSWPVHETRAVLTATGASSSHEVCLVRNGPSRCYHLAGFTIELRMTYGWWFRNLARKPVEVGSLSLYWHGVLHPFRWLALGFLNHQQYVQDHLNTFKSDNKCLQSPWSLLWTIPTNTKITSRFGSTKKNVPFVLPKNVCFPRMAHGCNSLTRG